MTYARPASTPEQPKPEASTPVSGDQKPKAPKPPNSVPPEQRFPFMKPGRCSSCGAEILWSPTDKGKNAPLDPIPVQVMFVDTGTQVVYARRAYVNHFATCPSAGQHRKTK